MGDKQTISSLVTGGEASAGPPLGPSLGPMGVNIMEVISAINEKTGDFKGMKIPVTVTVDSETKKWEIEVGIPSASALILKEANIQKGSGEDGEEKSLLTGKEALEIDKFRQEMIIVRSELRKVQNALRKDIEKLDSILKFFNIFFVPILLIIISIALGFIERRKRHQKHIVRETN